MKKKFGIIVITIIVVIIGMLALVACDNNAQPEPSRDIKIDNFQQLRVSFPATLLVPEVYNNESILVYNNEDLDYDEKLVIKNRIQFDNIVIESLIEGGWRYTGSEYYISVSFSKFEKLDYDNNFEGYEKTNINGYQAYRETILESNGNHNSYVYFVDEKNKVQYNVNCWTIIKDERIDTDVIINKYIDSMCLRNGVGFNS